MKLIRIITLLVAGVSLLPGMSRGQGLTLNFSANTGTVIQFNGNSDSFQFNNEPGSYQWTITDETGGSSAIGFQGSVINGPFQYGSITSSGSVEYASVDPNDLGFLEINDGTYNLTGNVNWIDIATYSSASGVINASLNVNVTDIVYSGSNPDLSYIEANQPGSLDVSFQFATGMDLNNLSSGSGPYQTTSYSGSLSVVPEPSPLALAGFSGLSLLLFRLRKIVITSHS